jgi:hypothetical protein
VIPNGRLGPTSADLGIATRRRKTSPVKSFFVRAQHFSTPIHFLGVIAGLIPAIYVLRAAARRRIWMRPTSTGVTAGALNSVSPKHAPASLKADHSFQALILPPIGPAERRGSSQKI